MDIRVLGCHGGEFDGLKTTCFQVGEKLLIDAGAMASQMTIEELVGLDDIIISHSHLDHIKDLAMLPEVVLGRRKTPVRVHLTPITADAIKKYFFNWVIWPDFTVIPNRKQPVIKFELFNPGDELDIGGIKVRTIKMKHTVESLGFIVGSGGSSLALSGDTGRTAVFWNEVNRRRDVKMIFAETSFPDEEDALARVAGHLTPSGLNASLKRLKLLDRPVYVYHLKPAYASEVEEQLGLLDYPGLSLLRQGMVFNL